MKGMMMARGKQTSFTMPTEMPTTLEGKLDLALIAFGQLSTKLDHEQRQRRLVIAVGSMLLVASLLLNAGLFLYGQDKTNELKDATAQINDFQENLCTFVEANRDFSINSITSLRESLIALGSTPEALAKLTPEERAEQEKQIAAFRKDLDDRIADLPDITCEVGSG